MGESDAALQLVCAVLVLAVPAGLLTAVRPAAPRRLLTVAAVALIAAVASLAVDTVLSAPVDGPARVLDAALAGSVAASVAVLAALRLGRLGGAVFAAAWSILVFQPIVAAVVGSVPSLVQTVFGAVDYAGVLATHVAAAASLVVVSLLPVPSHQAMAAGAPATIGRAVVGTLLVTVGAAAWMVGVERVVNAATGRTLGNAVVGLLLGALVWALIERIAGSAFAPVGLVAGAVLAWGSLGLGVAFLSPMALGASVVIGVAGGAAVVVRAREGAHPQRRGALAVIVSVAIGGLILALLADGFGMAATGSTALVAGQLGAVIVIGLGSAASGVLCWALAAGAITVNERARSARAVRARAHEGSG